MKLSYNPTYTFNSTDIFDYSDPPITYEAYSRQSPQWAALARTWVREGAEDVGRALELVGMAIVAVSQNGERYPLSGREGAEALRAAIEEQCPGHGDLFIKQLARGHYNYHFQRVEDILGNLGTPSAPSGGTVAPGK